MASSMKNIGKGKPGDEGEERFQEEVDTLPDAVKDDAIDDADTDENAGEALAGAPDEGDEAGDAKADKKKDKPVNQVFAKRNEANRRYDEKIREDLGDDAAADPDKLEAGAEVDTKADPEGDAKPKRKKPAIKDIRSKDEDAPDDDAGPEDDAQMRTLRVNGRDVEITDEELVTAAQKHLAAGDELSEAKQLKNELITALNSVKSRGETSPDDASEGDDPGDRETSDPLQDKIRETVESLQVDDLETASGKLAELLQDIRNPEELVARVTENVAAQQRVDKAQTHYQEKFPELIDNPKAQLYTAGAAQEMALDDMRQAGVPERFIRSVANDAGATLQYYGQVYRQQVQNEQAGGKSFGLLGPEVLADKAAELAIADLRLRGNDDDGAPQQERRDQRRSEKQTLMKQPRRQPRRRAVPQPMTLEESRKGAAVSARQHRGQAAH